MTYSAAIQTGEWEIAGGGTETPFTFERKTFLYMWNATTEQHAYYCQQWDMFVTDFRTMEVL